MARKTLLIALVALVCLTTSVSADVFRWDNGQLLPGTEGITPGPNVDLSAKFLRYAELRDVDLTRANFEDSVLRNARFWNSNFLVTIFQDANIREADFRGAVIHQSVFREA